LASSSFQTLENISVLPKLNLSLLELPASGANGCKNVISLYHWLICHIPSRFIRSLLKLQINRRN